MLFFAKPGFNVSLSSMNTVSKETIAAGDLFADVWGNIYGKIYLMTEGRSVKELQEKGDNLLAMMAPDMQSGVLSSGFVPSMMFPGQDRRQRNLANWEKFWNPSRVGRFKRALAEAAVTTGFTADAFQPFYRLLDPDYTPPADITIPEKLYGLPVPGAERTKSSFEEFVEGPLLWIAFAVFIIGSIIRLIGFLKNIKRRASYLIRPTFRKNSAGFYLPHLQRCW